MIRLDLLTAQLVDELGDAARSIAALLGGDPLTQIEAACGRVAADLASSDTRVAVASVSALMRARWPAPTDPPPSWWRTPVGRLVARTLREEDTGSVTHAVAADMLGVTRGTIARMMSRGGAGLEKHPDGRITRASVMALIARRDGPPR
jgi:hypothetical protein